MIWIPIILGSVIIAVIAVFAVEVITSPEVDREGHLIEDKYGTLGPKFKKGDPVPPEHEGKDYRYYN